MTEVLPKPEDLYAERTSRYTAADRISRFKQKEFHKLMRETGLVVATIGQLADQTRGFCNNVNLCKPFALELSGQDDLARCDLILANHQGPNTAEPDPDNPKRFLKKEGGAETLFWPAMCSDRTRPVLKSELVTQTFTLNPALWSKWVKARVIRAGNPIPLHRVSPPDAKLGKNGRRNYLTAMSAEARRVGQEMCKSVNNGKPVIIYPEGTRSPSGKILGMTSEIFEEVINEYLIPKMRLSAEPRLGLLIGHTLDVFPDGLSLKVPMYQGTVAMKGLPYNTTRVEDAIQSQNPQLDKIDDPKLLKQIARIFITNMQETMRTALSKLIIETRASEVTQE